MNEFLWYNLIVTETAVTKTWIYPKERFWEYIPSPETERWCRFFGFGHEETKPGAFLIGDTVYAHPDVVRHLKSYEAKRARDLGEIYEIAGPGPKRYVW